MGVGRRLERETTTDIEASTAYGTRYEEIVRDEIARYRDALAGRQPPGVDPTFRIRGSIDSISSDGGDRTIRGWVCTHGFETPVDFHVYAGGPAGVGTALGAGRADAASEPQVSAACGTARTSHRFAYTVPAAVVAQHAGDAIWIHGITPHGLGAANAVIDRSGVLRL